MKFFPKTVDSQFLVRVIRNEVSPEEREFFEAWLRESDEHKEEFGSFVLLWDKMGNARALKTPEPGLQFQRIRAAIEEAQAEINSRAARTEETDDRVRSGAENQSRVAGDTEKLSFYERYYPFFSWSASIAAVLVILFLSSRMFQPADKLPVIKKEAAPVVKLVERSTQKGERVTIPLEDGSIIYLNAFSRIRYPRAFSPDERVVELEGEAYFTVAPDKKRPFRVKCGSTTSEVLGTEFNIKYRSQRFNIVVARGVVKAIETINNNSVMLTRGLMTSYSASKGFSRPVRVNVSRYVAWMQNKLSFKQTPLRDVMNELEIFYNVKVTFKNKASKEKTITGVFEADSLDNILEIISLAMDVDIKRDGQSIIVR